MPRPRGLKPLRSGMVSVDGGDLSKLWAPSSLVPSGGPWTMDHAITEPLAPLQAPRSLESHSYGLNLHLNCIEAEARCLIEAGDALVTRKHTVLYKTINTTFICWNAPHSNFHFEVKKQVQRSEVTLQVHSGYRAEPGFLNPQAIPLPRIITSYLWNP